MTVEDTIVIALRVGFQQELIYGLCKIGSEFTKWAVPNRCFGI